MNDQKGFSLIEVLMAWCIASVTVMGLLHYQQVALFQVQQACWRSKAVGILSYISDSEDQLPALSADFNWYESLRQSIEHALPGGRMMINCVATQCDGWISWQDFGQQKIRFRVGFR